MKNPLLLIFIAASLGFACAYGLLNQSLKQQQDSFAKQQAAWQSEKAELEAALASASGRTVTLPGATKVVEVAKKVSPGEILDQLKAMKIVADQPRSSRLLVHQFENLIECGAAALPVIREFLAGNVDIDYDTAAFARGARGGRLSTVFNVPPSLRLGLFEALKNIGGDDAEKILADTLAATGRGLEVAFLARVFEEMSPGKYRAVALAAAHELLTRPLADASDKNDRGYLLATLTFLNDPSFAATAAAQVIQPDGKIDAAALKYLQQTQPDKALALALQSYQDPHITDAKDRERLAAVAFDSAGADPKADAFFRAALADASLPAENRNNLAQDLADRGYTNLHDPTAHDFQMMQNRLAMLDQLRAETTDPVVLAGIVEGQKDLTKFISTYVAQHPPQ